MAVAICQWRLAVVCRVDLKCMMSAIAAITNKVGWQ
jgi:hypothetical protein